MALWRYVPTKVLEKQILGTADGIRLPTKAAALCSQQEIGFIYKNHNSKLTFVGLPTFPPSLPSLTSDRLLPAKSAKSPQ